MLIFHLQFLLKRIAFVAGTAAFCCVRHSVSDESIGTPIYPKLASMDRKPISKKREYDHA